MRRRPDLQVTRQTLAQLLAPRSVAVIGASADASKTSGRPVLYLRKHGFAGTVLPVNPRVSQIDSLPCYADIDRLPMVPDTAIVLLGPDRCAAALAQLSRLGVGSAIVLAGGFGESGADGIQRQQALLAAAGPMRLLGPNTIGFVNVGDRVTLSASGALALDELHPGGVSMVSQSGGILGAVLSRAAAAGLGMAKLVATGNEADLDVADFLDVLADDAATRVIVLYLETVRDAARFLAAARRCVAAGKPVVAYKVGRSDVGARAAASHTGALAGSDRAYDALLQACGVLRAQRFSDLIDWPLALAGSAHPLRGNRVAILTSTGGAGTLLADQFGAQGLAVPVPDAATAHALRALQIDDQAVLDRNPIDVTLAGLQPALLRRILAVVLASARFDAVCVVVGSSALAQPSLVADALHDMLALAAQHGKALIAYVSPHAPAIGHALARQGITALGSPEACATALQAALHTSQPIRGGRLASAPPSNEAPGDLPVSAASPRDAEGHLVDEVRARAWLARHGVPTIAEQVVCNEDEALSRAGQWTHPGPSGHAAPAPERWALKALVPGLAHKSDAGAVALNLSMPDLPAAVGRMRQLVQQRTGHVAQRFALQAMAPAGVEMILGARRDHLGLLLLVGLGGTAAELLQDTQVLLQVDGDTGLDDAAVLAALQGLRLWPLLDGHRGAPRADVAALVSAVLALARAAHALGPHLIEMEINPLLVLPDAQGVLAVDALLRVAPAALEVLPDLA